MTNLVAELTLVLATNWTGYNFNEKELGFVFTNHIAIVKYETNTYPFTLKSTASSIAVWRDYKWPFQTNVIWNTITFTNMKQ